MHCTFVFKLILSFYYKLDSIGPPFKYHKSLYYCLYFQQHFWWISHPQLYVVSCRKTNHKKLITTILMSIWEMIDMVPSKIKILCQEFFQTTSTSSQISMNESCISISLCLFFFYKNGQKSYIAKQVCIKSRPRPYHAERLVNPKVLAKFFGFWF
jgi:hypothetical protein